jgi:His-Xaa-Ser system radical SAM maturase HxsB
MKKSVQLMFKSPSKHLTMEFQGGEPTLESDLMEFGIELAEEINKGEQREISYVLCTNSIHLTDRLLYICKKYHVVISTSLDGPQFLHNSNRGKKDSYEQVVAGISKARAVLGEERVSALMTTSMEGLNYPTEIVDEYVKLGFRSIFLRALNPYGLATQNDNWELYTERFISFYKTAFEHILEYNRKGKRFVEDFAAIILRKMLTPYCTGFVDLQSPAGVINSVLVYNYDGYVYASDESRMLAEYKDYTFRLGSVNDRYEDIVFGKKAKQIANVWANEALAGCSDCALKAYCGADPVRNYSTQGDMYGNRATSLLCKKNKAIIEYLISLIIERRDEVMPIFRNWLS